MKSTLLAAWPSLSSLAETSTNASHWQSCKGEGDQGQDEERFHWVCGGTGKVTSDTLGLIFLEHGNLLTVLVEHCLDCLALLDAALLAGLTLNDDQ